jgi:hypothetical protein
MEMLAGEAEGGGEGGAMESVVAEVAGRVTECGH